MAQDKTPTAMAMEDGFVFPRGIGMTVAESTVVEMTNDEWDEFWTAYGRATRVVMSVRARLSGAREGEAG